MTDTQNNAIAANINALAETLETIAANGREAAAAIANRDRNQAIGWIVGLDELLTTAKSLQGAAIALHRQH